jgi:hypothetical protein
MFTFRDNSNLLGGLCPLHIACAGTSLPRGSHANTLSTDRREPCVTARPGVVVSAL